LKREVARKIVNLLTAIVGRQRMVRGLRFVTNTVRFDGPNQMASNGEAYVQRCVLTDPNPIVFDVGCHFGEWSRQLLDLGEVPSGVKPMPEAARLDHRPRNSLAKIWFAMLNQRRRQNDRRAAKRPAENSQSSTDTNPSRNTPIIHAFEPSRFSYARTRDSLAGRASVHNIALSDFVDTVELGIVHEGAGSNSLVPFTDVNRRGSTEIVTVSTIDQFCNENGVQSIDLCKIDAEGHDLAVIRGASRMLEENKIGMIQFEYNSRWIDARCFLLDAFVLLEGFDFRLGKVTPAGIEMYDRWDPELETFREANFLAVQPEWVARLPTVSWWG
jgi:FkbM family methyltransferase